jgi:signal transduction histidine kinase
VTDGDTRPAAAAAPEPVDGTAVALREREAALWAETLQEIASVVAHDLRNALNAVAVNLEVVRARSARGADASAIAPFAATAANHFEIAAAAAEALLGFARPEPGRADVAALVGRLRRLLSVGEVDRLRVTDRSDGNAITAASSDCARVAVARSVLIALGTAGAGEQVACEITVNDGILLRVICPSRAPPLPDPRVVAAAATNGIQFRSRERSLELRFPSSTNASFHASS